METLETQDYIIIGLSIALIITLFIAVRLAVHFRRFNSISVSLDWAETAARYIPAKIWNAHYAAKYKKDFKKPYAVKKDIAKGGNKPIQKRRTR